MRKIEWTRAWIFGALLGFSSQADAQLLKGQLNGFQSESVIITYSPDGNMFNNVTNELKTDAEGHFTLDVKLPVKAVDASVNVGIDQSFGVHLAEGKTVEMSISRTEKGYSVDFKGSEAELSRCVNRAIQAFSMNRYLSSNPDVTIEARRNLLEKEYGDVVAMLSQIKDKETRDYYIRLSEAQYKWLKLRMLMDEAREKAFSYTETDEFRRLSQGVDINDLVNIRANLSMLLLNAKLTTQMTGNNEDYCREQMAVVDRYVTSPVLRSQMVFLIGANYFVYGDGTGDYHSFANDYMQFAGRDSVGVKELVQPFLMKQDAMQRMKPGKMAPDITLNTADGQEVSLSSLLKGKFTYIDVWATWCGPCAQEIPYFEKLVSKFQDNDKIQFVSISIDSDKEAWKKKLETDRPQWQQYILTRENSKKFLSDWGISGIPRFIMINADGTIFSSEAPRPSETKTTSIIEEQTE